MGNDPARSPPYTAAPSDRGHERPPHISRRGAAWWPLVAGGVPGDEVGGVLVQLGAPTRAVGAVAGGVPTQAGDHRPGVAAVREGRDPVASAGCPPDLEAGRVKRAGEQASAVQGEADGPGAVVTARGERAVAAAPYVGKIVDLIGGLDRAADGERSVRWRD